MHQPFASQHYNTHWVSFRFTTSSIHFSSVQSTRCPLFGSPAIPTSAAFSLHPYGSFPPSISPTAAGLHLHSSAASVPLMGNILRRLPMELASPFVPHGFTDQPLVGARSHLRSFLSSVAYGGSPPALQCGQVCRTATLLF
jgi:hypothetical protein